MNKNIQNILEESEVLIEHKFKRISNFLINEIDGSTIGENFFICKKLILFLEDTIDLTLSDTSISFKHYINKLFNEINEKYNLSNNKFLN